MPYSSQDLVVNGLVDLGQVYRKRCRKNQCGVKVFDFNSAKTSNTEIFGKYFRAMLKRGVYLAPSQFESLFLSTALDEEQLDHVIQANEESLQEVMNLK